MATPKLNRLAKRFMQQIQDPIIEAPDDPDMLLPGKIIRSISEIEHYLGMAMMKFIEEVWKSSNANPNIMLSALPDIYEERELIIPQGSQKVNVSTTHADIWDILNSRKNNNIILEAWHTIHLTDAVNRTDPFYIGNERHAGIIYQKPFIWLFPKSLSAASNFNFTLCFLKAPLNPVDGTYLTINGEYDIPFSDIHLTTIASIAEKIYKLDDYQEDAG